MMAFISFPMSTLLHRYFAHDAFRTTRLTQFIFATISCLAYQRGPVWWASKHKRHHRHCDTKEDPHSWKMEGFWIAFILWTLKPSEWFIDEEYVPKLMQYPEMLLVDEFCITELDTVRFLSEIVGESHHLDHHHHPNRVK